jgi:uncharacterized protein DUF1648
MTLLVSFFAALAAAIVAMTILHTAASYSSLPPEVPMQFNWDGTVRSTASRPMIWFTVVIQVFVSCVMLAAGYAIATNQPGAHGSLLGLSIVAVCVNAIIWRVQTMLVSSAISGAKRVPMSGFLVFFVPCFALILIAAFAIH